jgi:hypothetical protein
MSMFSRRSILSRFLASVPAAAMVGGAAPALALAPLPESGPSESDGVLALCQQFDVALAELRAARANKTAAEEVFYRFLPPLPAKLLLKNEDRRLMYGERTDGITVGRGWSKFEVKSPDYKIEFPTRYRAVAKELKFLKKHSPARSEGGRLARRLLPIAEKYERGVKTAARKSKIVAAYERYGHAEYEAGKLARDAARAEPMTWAGLRSKALAISVADELGDAKLHVQILGAEHLSADIMRLVGLGRAA